MKEQTMKKFLKNSVVFITLSITTMYVEIPLHELGHLIASKALGLKVSEVVIGTGKELTNFSISGTTYYLNLIPTQGDVKIPIKDLTPLQELIVTAAGPATTILIGILAFALFWNTDKWVFIPVSWMSAIIIFSTVEGSDGLRIYELIRSMF